MPKISKKNTPKFIKFSSNSIALGLKILADAILQTSYNGFSNQAKGWAEYLDLLSEKIEGNLTSEDIMELWNKHGTDKLEMPLNHTATAWKNLLKHKSFYKQGWLHKLLENYQLQFMDRNLADLYDLFIHIFHPTNKKAISLNNLVYNLNLEKKRNYLTAMLKFINEADSLSITDNERAKLIKQTLPAIQLCLEPLKNGKNFIQLLIDKINYSIKPKNYAEILYRIVRDNVRFEKYHLELLKLMQNLNNSEPEVEESLYRSLKLILERKKAQNTNTQNNVTTEIFSDIKKIYPNGRYKQELLNLLYEQSQVDYKSDIIKAFFDGETLKYLTDTFQDPISLELLPKDELVYGPKFIRNATLYFRTTLEKCFPEDKQQLLDPVTKCPVEGMRDYLEVSDPFLSIFLKNLAILNTLNTTNPTVEENDKANKIAGLILNLSIEPLPIQQKTSGIIDDILMLRKYYCNLVAIKEFFLFETDPITAKELLVNSLLGSANSKLNSQIHILRREIFNCKISLFIEYINKTNGIINFLIEPYLYQNQKYNLITACMYNLRKPWLTEDVLADYTKLLSLMINKVNENDELLKKLSEFQDSENRNFIQLLIWTIYDLTARNNNEVFIKTYTESLILCLEKLSKFTVQQLLQPENENNETSYYLDLKDAFKNTPNLQFILTAQNNINKVINNNPILSSTVNCYLYYIEHYFRSDIDQIIGDVMSAQKNMKTLFTHIVEIHKPDFDKSKTIDCFIRHRFNEIIDYIEEKHLDIYSILSASDNFYVYLSNLCEAFKKIDSQSKHLENLAANFLKHLIGSYVSQDITTQLPHAHIKLLKIIPKLVGYLKEAEIEEILNKFTQENALDEQQIHRTKIISIILKEIKSSMTKKKPKKQHQMEMENESQIIIEFNLSYVMNYFIFAACQKNTYDNEKLGLILNSIQKFDISELEALLATFVELNKFFPDFISDTFQIIANIIATTEIVNPFANSAKLIELAKSAIANISKLKINKNMDFLQKEMQMLTALSSIVTLKTQDLEGFMKVYFKLFKPFGNKYVIIARYAKIIKNFLGQDQVEIGKFRKLLIQKCYKGLGKVLFYDFDLNKPNNFKNSKVSINKRGRVKLLLDCLQYTDNKTIDWYTFTCLCQQLLFEEKLTDHAKKYTHKILNKFSFEMNYKKYDALIQQIKTSTITINWADMEYIYPDAFQKAFSGEKNQIENYIVIYKFNDQSILVEALNQKTINYKKEVISRMILDFDDLNPFSHTEELASNIIDIANSKNWTLYSKYSQSRVLYTLLYKLKSLPNLQPPVDCATLSEQRKDYLSFLETVNKLLKNCTTLSLFNKDDSNIHSSLDSDILLQVCIHALNIAGNEIAIIINSHIQVEINCVKTILTRISKESFLQFAVYILTKHVFSTEPLLYKIFFADKEIKKHMFIMLFEVFKHHACMKLLVDAIKQKHLQDQYPVKDLLLKYWSEEYNQRATGDVPDPVGVKRKPETQIEQQQPQKKQNNNISVINLWQSGNECMMKVEQTTNQNSNAQTMEKFVSQQQEALQNEYNETNSNKYSSSQTNQKLKLS